jgi:hypothetical protein
MLSRNAFLMLDAMSVLQALAMSRSCVNDIGMFVSKFILRNKALPAIASILHV